MLNNLETKKLSTNKANEQKKINGYQVHVASYDQNDKYKNNKFFLLHNIFL